MKLENIAVVAARDDSFRVGGVPDHTAHRRFEEKTVQEASIQSVPDDECIVVAAAHDVRAIGRKGQVVDGVAVTSRQGEDLNVRSVRVSALNSHSASTRAHYAESARTKWEEEEPVRRLSQTFKL